MSRPLRPGSGAVRNTPVGALVADRVEIADGNVQPDPVVAPARLEQQHGVARVGAEPVGDQTAGGAGADDDVIVSSRSCRHRPARDVAAALDFQRRLFATATLQRQRAARMKRAARRRIERRGRLAGEDHPLLLGAGLGDRRRRQQRARIGMLRASRRSPPARRSRRHGRDRSPSPRRRCGARPRDRARRTHRRAGTPPAIRRAGSAPARGSRRRAPRPARRARGFSASAQRARDRDALALAAGKHVRIAVMELRPQPDLRHHRERRGLALGGAHVRC